MNEARPVTPAGGTALGYVLTFLCTAVVARVMIDLVEHGTMFHAEAWAALSAWVAPVGFAAIACFAYWYRTRP